MVRRTSKSHQAALLAKGVRSGLEDVVTDYLKSMGVGFSYEAHALPYVPPVKTRKYTPDFFLDNGIIIETKGRFDTDDRQKMIMVKSTHPELDIRLVFSNAKTFITTQKVSEHRDWLRASGHGAGPIPTRLLDATRAEFFIHLKSIGKKPPSSTTYAMWAEKNGFPWADKLPPETWLNEPPNEQSRAALERIISC